MNNDCKICGKPLPLTKTKLGIPVAGKINCDVCAKLKTKITTRLREDKEKLIRHYDTVKKELQVIEELKELITQGEDVNARTKELLETGHAYWEKYDLSKYYKSNPEKSKAIN